MNLERERDKALARARGFAKSGKSRQAQYWLDRAESFAPVSERQVSNLNKLLTKRNPKRNTIPEKVEYRILVSHEGEVIDSIDISVVDEFDDDDPVDLQVEVKDIYDPSPMIRIGVDNEIRRILGQHLSKLSRGW